MTIGKRFLKFFFVTLAFFCLPVLAGLAGPAGLPACFGEPAAQAAAPLFGTQSIQDGARLLQQPERLLEYISLEDTDSEKCRPHPDWKLEMFIGQ